LNPQVLVTPHEKEPMLMYIAATNQVFITVLIIECVKEGKTHSMQRSVYYIREVLLPNKHRYPH
jgi:hypothetical protein